MEREGLSFDDDGFQEIFMFWVILRDLQGKLSFIYILAKKTGVLDFFHLSSA